MKKLISMLFMTVLTLTVMTGCDNDETILQKFTVVFDSQGGSEVAEQSVYAGEKIVQPINPTKEKAFFSGWYKEAECTNAWEFATESVSQDLTLYAKWTDIAYTVTFESNGGSAVEAKQIPEGGTIGTPQPVPTKEGYLFEGWYTEMTLSTQFDFSTPITKDITLYAKWMDIASIDQNDLTNLFNQAMNIVRGETYAYTEESLAALKTKTEEVRPVVNNPSSTQEEIATAYQALHNAMLALVEAPYRPTASLQISPEPTTDGIIPVYLSQGSAYIVIYGLDAQGNLATRPEISLEFDGNKLSEWGNYYYYGEGSLQINFKQDLESGSTFTLKVICGDVPSLSTTLTLKTVNKEEQKKDFLDLAKTFPSEITFDNYKEAYTLYTKISNTYWNLTEELKNDNEIKAAYEVLNQSKIWQFSSYDFKFEGNTWVATTSSGIVYYEYKADGDFPCGTYTSEWVDWGYDQINYDQTKIILKSDNTFEQYYRQATSIEGQATAEWGSSGSGIYKLTGNQADGGTLITQFQ